MNGFFKYKNYKYFKSACGVTLLCILIYLFHQPQQEPNGGTWLGYGLGTIGALLIFWLMYYGRRKRDYLSNNGTLKGWLSAHVYLGVALLFIATLHTGFQFGWNIHTLAYALMCLAILSGIYGAWAYLTLPGKKRNNLEGRSVEECFHDIEELNKLIRASSVNLNAETSSLLSSAIDRTELGGSFWQQISAQDSSKCIINGKLQPNEEQQACISVLVTEMSVMTEPEKIKQTKRIIDLLTQRKNILRKIRKDIRINALLQFWLFFHIPISTALLAALLAHIISVFLYW